MSRPDRRQHQGKMVSNCSGGSCEKLRLGRRNRCPASEQAPHHMQRTTQVERRTFGGTGK
jgi:hypothetical protein